MAEGITRNTHTAHQGLWQWAVRNIFWSADIHNDMRNGVRLHLSSCEAHAKHCPFMTSYGR